jgi:hypothetical protein
MTDDREQPERPRVEPEIIPPERGGRGTSRSEPFWGPGVFTQQRGTHRVFVGRVGPFGIALLLLAIAAVVALALIVLVGAVLIWIPVIAVVAVAAAFAGLFRRR